MSISSELLTLNNTKTAIRTAINNKGGNVGANDTFASYATAITNLPSGGGNKLLTSIDVSDFSGTTFNQALTYITDVTIPSGVTTIGDSAFEGASSITSVTIPNGVTTIGTSVFKNCSSLSSVTIPNGVSTIPSSCFYSCSSLTSVTIPSGVTSIGASSFYSCSSLTSVTIPSGVTSIGNTAFTRCTSLQSITCLATTPPTLGSTVGQSVVFNDTGNCPIYVPSESLNAFKTAQYWSNYSSRIYGLADVATVDNTTVTNADLGMTNMIVGQSNMPKMPSGNVVVFAEGVTGIQAAINGYTTVTLPSTLTNIMNQIGMIGSSVTTLTCLATTPPSASSAGIGGDNLTHLYVPASSIDSYKAHSAWTKFSSIIEAIPGTVVTSITFAQYQVVTNPADWGEFEGCSEDVNVDAFPAASSSSTFDSDIKASGDIVVLDNNGNDITSQCTFSSNDYSKWDSTQDPSYDGESEVYYEWRLDTNIEDTDAQNPHSATITATYGNLSDTFTIEWTTTSNCEEPEPDPEEPEE